jgi:hypothetical protein
MEYPGRKNMLGSFLVALQVPARTRRHSVRLSGKHKGKMRSKKRKEGKTSRHVHVMGQRWGDVQHIICFRPTLLDWCAGRLALPNFCINAAACPEILHFMSYETCARVDAHFWANEVQY